MKVNIPEKYTDLYIKALGDKKKALQMKINQFKAEIEEIDSHLSNLVNLPLFQENEAQNLLHQKTNAYHDQWAWTKKIAYFIDFKRKLVKTNEVVDFIMEKEPDLNKSKVRSSVSAALSNKMKKGVYRKFEDPVTSNTYYGPVSFFLNQHEPQIEFMPEDLKERLLYNN
ncbi:hypothetical protein QYS49_31810 [Marivirga salinae]|uniref:Uncharacterized protein n=1 Tax=Marivirga salinarum TaxID=3059078 RepID=A0AA51R961_9BACT|nr:hypothetical protein [Marivirga sp. BDSF4-3]WMN11927.1 hypothetical protein QYS49_31810 [Marivirga sp. BDSF4-3]